MVLFDLLLMQKAHTLRYTECVGCRYWCRRLHPPRNHFVVWQLCTGVSPTDSQRHKERQPRRFLILDQEVPPKRPVIYITENEYQRDSGYYQQTKLTAVTLGLSIHGSMIIGPTECTTTTVLGFTLATC